jgi:Hydroxymethylglutaryl-coenzyme A synthase N terminal
VFVREKESYTTRPSSSLLCRSNNQKKNLPSLDTVKKGDTHLSTEQQQTTPNNYYIMSALAVGAAVGALGMEAAKRLSASSLSLSPATEQYESTRSSNLKDKNVGILAIEVYTPSTYIEQKELEEHSGVSAGKYTLGLGQDGLGFCGDSEDVNSLALTVVHSLLEK